MLDLKLQFKILFKFHESISVDTEQYIVNNIKPFFTMCHDNSNIVYEASIDHVNQIRSKTLYEENFFEVYFTVKYKNTPRGYSVEKLYREVCQNWCNRNIHLTYFLWLSPMKNECLSGKKKQFHSDVSVSEFGFGTVPDMKHFVEHYCYKEISAVPEIMSSFYHSRRYLHLYLRIKHSKLCNVFKTTHKFEIHYQSIFRLCIDVSQDSIKLYFYVAYPPFLYMLLEDKPEDETKEEIASTSLKTDSLLFDQAYQHCNWERTFDFGCNCNHSLCCIKKIGKCSVMKVSISDRNRAHDIISRLTERCAPSTEFYYTSLEVTHPKLIPNFSSFSFCSEVKCSGENECSKIFNCQYAWESFQIRSFEIYDQLALKLEDQRSALQMSAWYPLKQKLINYFKVNPTSLASALFYIYDLFYSRNRMIDFEDALKYLFEYFSQNPVDDDLPDGMCLVKRAIITPSKLILLPPLEHFDNRVIREFGMEYMLRLSIQDDNFSKLTFAVPFNSDSGKEFVEKAFGRMLREGIRIGNRAYEVLAASNSQLRDHGLWFFAKDSAGNTASDIRHWLGNFSCIKNVAKCMARMGQCFTSSEEAYQIELGDSNKIHLNDIKTDDRKYTFSDGIGMISPKLAKEVREVMKGKKNYPFLVSHYEPSAFQIRYKGCKGMVAEMPFLGGCTIGIRPSMVKFECETYNKLEIVKVSAPRALFLNRPLITILEQLNVKKDVFLRLQKKAILDLTDSLLFEDKAALILSDYISLNFPFQKLKKAGVILTEEPFFRTLLLSVYKTSVDNLRTKARIPIPHEYGRNMLGILDETRTLKYGQVFVQYSQKLGSVVSPVKRLEGKIVVSKNPCLHPGDVRLMEAVDVPLLHHIKDCIVFPANGHRPHPDEMAGSDLDGDEYVVLWLPELIFPSNKEPMNFPTSCEADKGITEEITVKHMIDFLCDYIRNDNIGTFANAHLAWADWHPNGIFSEECMSIAQKYPFVLDFAKTGSTKRLSASERPKLYPEFMEKGCTSNNYLSKRALGILFRTTRILEACVSKIDVRKYDVKFDPTLKYHGWEEFKEWAEKCKSEYTSRVNYILNKYGIQSETEALSGYVDKVSLFNQSRQEKANVLALARSYLLATISKYRCKFLAANNGESEEKKYQRASSWYMVVYNQGDQDILSFPWILSDILAEIKIDHMTRNNIVNSDPKALNLTSSFLFKTLDDTLNSVYRTYIDHQSSRCFCDIVGEFVLNKWFKKNNVNCFIGDEKPCSNCFLRIFEYFKRESQVSCCSGQQNVCSCSLNCSPGRFILDFLRFYISRIPNKYLGKCEGNCEGFRAMNVCSVALQTYANFILTRNMCYIDVGSDSENMDFENQGLESEGDPIRIPINDKAFEHIITEHTEDVIELLKKYSGVKEIYISADTDRRGKWFILVNSIGKDWQRWSLEDMLMNPSLSKKLSRQIMQ